MRYQYGYFPCRVVNGFHFLSFYKQLINKDVFLENIFTYTGADPITVL